MSDLKKRLEEEAAGVLSQTSAGDLLREAAERIAEPVTPEQAAYGALWRMMTANPFLKDARACLLTAIGGQGSQGQREAVAWAVATFEPVSDAEISAIGGANG